MPRNHDVQLESQPFYGDKLRVVRAVGIYTSEHGTAVRAVAFQISIVSDYRVKQSLGSRIAVPSVNGVVNHRILRASRVAYQSDLVCQSRIGNIACVHSGYNVVFGKIQQTAGAL